MEKLIDVLKSFQDEVWFYDFRVEEETFFENFEEFNIELIVTGEFQIRDLMTVVSDIKENGYNVESFFETEKRGIKDTYSIRFGVWRRWQSLAPLGSQQGV